MVSGYFEYFAGFSTNSTPQALETHVPLENAGLIPLGGGLADRAADQRHSGRSDGRTWLWVGQPDKGGIPPNGVRCGRRDGKQGSDDDHQ